MLCQHDYARSEKTIVSVFLFLNLVQKIMKADHKIADFILAQDTKIKLDLNQGVFRNKLEEVNKYIDEKFQDVSKIYLDENQMFDSIKEQVKHEEEVDGR